MIKSPFLPKQRGKFRPNLVNLVQMNTPRVVMQETKKAFRNIFKREDLQSGLTAMCNLKGVGPAMASGREHSPRNYRARKNGLQNVINTTQAGPGRLVRLATIVTNFTKPDT